MPIFLRQQRIAGLMDVNLQLGCFSNINKQLRKNYEQKILLIVVYHLKNLS